MSDQTNVSLKFGGGYEAPWLTVYGTPAEIKAQLIEATGLDAEHHKDWTVTDVISEASRLVRGSHQEADRSDTAPVTATRVEEATPETFKEEVKKKAPAKKAAAKKSLAQRAKDEAPEPGPEVEELPATPLSIEEQIAAAESVDDLHVVWQVNEKQWTEKHTELAKARRIALEGK